jgi:SAM domain (Sterile alpha motif)
MDVMVWLRSLGLERYEGAFRENETDERVLPNLTQEDLKEIGVGPVGHRRILLEAIAALGTDAGGKALTAQAATALSAPRVAAEDRAERRQRRNRGETDQHIKSTLSAKGGLTRGKKAP